MICCYMEVLIATCHLSVLDIYLLGLNYFPHTREARLLFLEKWMILAFLIFNSVYLKIDIIW